MSSGTETPWEGIGIDEEQELHPAVSEDFPDDRELTPFRERTVEPESPRRRSRLPRLLCLIAGTAAAAVIAVSAPVPSEAPPPEPVPITEPVTEPETEPPTEPVTEPITEPPTEPITEPPTEPITEPPTEPETEPVTQAQLTDAEILVSVGTWHSDGIAVHFAPGGAGWWDGGGRYGVMQWSEDADGHVSYSGWGSWTVVEDTESGDSGEFYPVSKLKKESCSGTAALTATSDGYLLQMDNPIGIDSSSYSGGQPADTPDWARFLSGMAPAEYMTGRQWHFAQQQDGRTDWLYTDIRPASLTFGEDGCTVTCQVYFDGALAHEFSFVAAVEYPENQPNTIRLVLPEYPMQFIFTYDGWTVNDGIYQKYLFCSLLLTADGPRMTTTSLNEFISYASEYALMEPETIQ